MTVSLTAKEIIKITVFLPTNFKPTGTIQKSIWKLINQLSSRNNSVHKTISNITIGEERKNAPKNIAKMFNSHFAKVGKNLASDIPPSAVEPEVYVVPTETTFSLKPPTVNTVYRYDASSSDLFSKLG